MSIDYINLAEKLGNKLNTIGEQAFKVGAVGVKYEALGQLASLSLGIVVFGYIGYTQYKKCFDKTLTRDEQGGAVPLTLLSNTGVVVLFIILLMQLPTIVIALNQPEYIIIQKLLGVIK
jgi:hypothetical protein